MFPTGFVACLSLTPKVSHLEYCRRLLAQAEFSDVQHLKFLPGLPSGMWICRDIHPATAPVKALRGDKLLQAAILGLCNNTFYSPDRPLIWTESRLRRRVQLFAVGDFYVD